MTLVIGYFNVSGHPRIQRIVLNGHEWFVPDEPEWKASKYLPIKLINKYKHAFLLLLVFFVKQFCKISSQCGRSTWLTAKQLVIVDWAPKRCVKCY